jgi:uncharacterized membrane protein
MQMTLSVLGLLPWLDWLALLSLFGGWIGYALFARHRSVARRSLLAVTNAERRRWMLQATWRDNRTLDAIVVQNLSTAPSFFASTTILIIGGLLAVLSTTERASELVQQMPFAARTSVLVFDLKLLLLLGIVVYAFFRFTWSLRQYSFGALLVASAPDWQHFEQQPTPAREAFADRAGRVVGLAAETFNDGLRAYYMAFAAIAWFFSPVALMVATAAVVCILYRREFRSEMLEALNEG